VVGVVVRVGVDVTVPTGSQYCGGGTPGLTVVIGVNVTVPTGSQYCDSGAQVSPGEHGST
jgi:hypothetical protein